MKIALLGAGKTGSKITELHQDVTVFNSSNVPTLETLKGHDVVISFLAGPVFMEYVPMLIESRLPVVSGSTGIEFSDELKNELTTKKLKWIWASNFSLGMNLVHEMLLTMSKASKLFDEYDFSIHEVHHTKKLDAPSGTAISWEKWIGEKAHITHEREGDVIGFHELHLNSPTEEIKISHNAKDRAIFAKGALWAANKILKDNSIEYGFNYFSDITRKELL